MERRHTRDRLTANQREGEAHDAVAKLAEVSDHGPRAAQRRRDPSRKDRERAYGGVPAEPQDAVRAMSVLQIPAELRARLQALSRRLLSGALSAQDFAREHEAILGGLRGVLHPNAPMAPPSAGAETVGAGRSLTELRHELVSLLEARWRRLAFEAGATQRNVPQDALATFSDPELLAQCFLGYEERNGWSTTWLLDENGHRCERLAEATYADVPDTVLLIRTGKVETRLSLAGPLEDALAASTKFIRAQYARVRGARAAYPPNSLIYQDLTAPTVRLRGRPQGSRTRRLDAVFPKPTLQRFVRRFQRVTRTDHRLLATIVKDPGTSQLLSDPTDQRVLAELRRRPGSVKGLIRRYGESSA